MGRLRSQLSSSDMWLFTRIRKPSSTAKINLRNQVNFIQFLERTSLREVFQILLTPPRRYPCAFRFIMKVVELYAPLNTSQSLIKKNLVYLRCVLEGELLSRDNTLSLVCIHSAAKLYNSSNNSLRTKCLRQGRHASICVIVDPETDPGKYYFKRCNKYSVSANKNAIVTKSTVLIDSIRKENFLDLIHDFSNSNIVILLYQFSFFIRVCSCV